MPGQDRQQRRDGDKPIALKLLGRFELVREGQLQRLPRKAQGLLAHLAVKPGRHVERERLATLLWGNIATEQARQSLRQCLVAVRDAVGRAASEVLVADGESVVFQPSSYVNIDVQEFETADRSSTLADIERGYALYQGEFLAGLQIPVEPFSEWVSIERQRLAGIRHDLLQRLAQKRARAGDIEGATIAAKQLTLLDPLREEGHRMLMRLLTVAGNRSAALKQWELCMQLLRDELGIAPDAETEQLAETIRAGHPIPLEANGTISAAPAQQPSDDRGTPVAAQSGPLLPDRPSIAVLPFANLSGDTGHDYFIDGLVEDITVALGRESWLFVIASPSAFAFRDRAVDLRQVGAELGVRYVLRGSVRRDGGRVRIVVRLIDTLSRTQLWSDRFEDEVDNVFAMNDRLMAQVAAAIAPALRARETERAQRKPPESLTAFDLYVRALPLLRTNLEDNRKALGLLDRAIALDPAYSAAYGLAARCYQFQKMMGWLPPSDPRLEEGVQLGHLAAELGANDSEALWMAGLALVQLAGEIDHGLALIDRSLALNSNSANAWSSSCVVHAYLGDVEQAIDHFQRSRRLNPLDQTHHLHWNMVGLAYLSAARYEDADAAADKTLNVRPTYPPGLRLKVATCGLLGRIEEGRACVERLLAVHPECSVSWLQEFWGPMMRRNLGTLDRFVEGARRAGLPETH